MRSGVAGEMLPLVEVPPGVGAGTEAGATGPLAAGLG